MKIYQRLSNLISARANCIKHKNLEWFEKHEDTILNIVKDKFPSGSGFDSGTEIDLKSSTPEKLVFGTSFHHMNENGMYDGWTEHTVTVKASLMYGHKVGVSGRNRNDIKEYISQVFGEILDTEENK